MKISAAVFAGEKSSHWGRNKALQGIESRRFMVKTAKGSDTFNEVFFSDASVSGLIIRLINEFISRSCLMV